MTTQNQPPTLPILTEQAKNCFEHGNYARAQQLYQQILSIVPNDTHAIYQLALSLHQQMRYEQAIVYYQQLLTIAPHNGVCLSHLGICYYQLGQRQQTIQYFQDAIALEPNEPTIHNNFGFILLRMNQLDKAEFHLCQAIKLDATLAIAYTNMGNLMRKRHQWPQAIQYFEKSLSLNAKDHQIYNYLYHGIRTLCQWDKLADYEQKMLSLSSRQMRCGDPSFIDPFLAIFLPINLNTLTQIVASKQQAVQYHTKQLFHHQQIPQKKITKKLRIGYVSSGFRHHATGHLIENLFKYHDHETFSLYGYALLPDDKSSQYQNIKNHCDIFNEVSDIADKEIAQIIYQDKIDILIDIDGYTEYNRQGIFHYKPAPIHVNFLGYPGSLQNKYTDYIIADDIVLPIENEKFFSEKPARLPHCYQMNAHQDISLCPPPSRKTLGLPEDAFVYACFNVSRKIDKEIFNIWMKILKKVERSVLWLLSDAKETTDHLQHFAKLAGVAADRVITTQRCDLSTHLARQQVADLFLDTIHCNAHTTATDALWGELPVLTCLGETFANRISASIVTAAGLSDLVVNNLVEYEKLAVALSQHTDKLAYYKHHLQLNKHSCPLFQTKNYVKNLENLYQKMWQQYMTGEPAKTINL